MLPILHLNGYKIANPTVLARIPEEELVALLRGLRLPAAPRLAATSPTAVHQRFAAALDAALDEIAAIQRAARDGRRDGAPALADDRAAHAEGLDGPEGGRRPAGRGHVALAPGAARRTSAANPEHLRVLEEWLRSYRPEELFDERRTARRASWPRWRPRASAA